MARVDTDLAGPLTDLLNGHLMRLRRLGGEHPNRVLHHDQVLVSLLLGFYDPAVDSLRTLDARSCTSFRLQDATDNLRTARSTMSDALKQMPPERIWPLVAELVARLPASCNDPALADLVTLKKRITAIDGSYFRVPCDVLWALAHDRRNGVIGRQVRLDLHLDVLRFLPLKLEVNGEAKGSESGAFAGTLEAGCIYLADRNFVDFTFIQKALDIEADFVVRLKKSTVATAIETRVVDETASAAGVLSDQIVELRGSAGTKGLTNKSQDADKAQDAKARGFAQLREVVVFDPVKQEEVRLLTTLPDVSAEMIGKLYRHRWSIELFYRWLKCIARVKHLYAENAEGITTQFYVMLIATLLMHLKLGERPSKYTMVLMSSAASGTLDVERVDEVLERLARERELDRVARQRRAKQAKA